MKLIGRAVGSLLAFSVVAALVSVAAAVAMKQRLVRTDDPDANEIHLVAAFEPLSFISRAGALRSGTIDAWYGGGIIDLRGAELDPAGATLRVRTVFGGAQLVVPQEWEVTNRAISIFGGVGDARPAQDRPADAPRLTIEGVAFFGGLGVTSDVSEAAERQLAEAVSASRNEAAQDFAEPAF